jgi:plastocyanin
MTRTSLIVAIALGSFILTPAIGYAQGSAVVMVRPGDTIEWSVISAGPHQVRFGGTVAGAPLPTISAIQAILDFPPPPAPQLTIDGDEALSPAAGGGKLLTATVKANAAVGTKFSFTCGMHPAQMASVTFAIAASDGLPPRTHKIFGETGLNWHLHADTTP